MQTTNPMNSGAAPRAAGGVQMNPLTWSPQKNKLYINSFYHVLTPTKKKYDHPDFKFFLMFNQVV